MYQIGDIFNWETVVPTDIEETIAATGTPEALASSETLFQSATLVGNSADRTANTSTAYLGSSTNQEIPIGPGQVFNLVAPEGKRLNLADWFLRVGTNGDGVRGVYVI